MPAILEKMLPPGAIEEMKPVPEAYVPIIKLMIFGTDIDLNFTRLAVPSVPWDLDVKDTNLLRGLDDRELRALNGPRVADELLQLVPQKKTFRTALRAIKLWAQSTHHSSLKNHGLSDFQQGVPYMGISSAFLGVWRGECSLQGCASSILKLLALSLS